MLRGRLAECSGGTKVSTGSTGLGVADNGVCGLCETAGGSRLESLTRG